MFLDLAEPNGAIKALGAKRWQALHKSVYAIGLLHFLSMRDGKHEFAQAAVYAAMVARCSAGALSTRFVRG